MTSQRKVKSNRQNAQKSRGPKTFDGRRRAARNALRHGLTLSLYTDPSASAAVESLARIISGSDADETALPLARRVAEAEFDVRRIRRARDELISRRLSDPCYDTRAADRQKVAILGKILKGKFDGPMKLDELISSQLDPSEKLGAILLREARALRSLDRYEGRALSRRKLAVRAFGASRRPKK